eukprot:CAMPEP_0177752510 /NCGR_PEP_ID=MMETSP0491_2-20121128/959_1 /TAXON_ID=63592 /ORGANISM="Tetraselmis chuii, Strain PLY429" /LENGTH=92 /DNA_ID=CAMNT_0019267721 /DNA_START=446 /DNA_END=724 /DNA_ORIENTATION=+
MPRPQATDSTKDTAAPSPNHPEKERGCSAVECLPQKVTETASPGQTCNSDTQQSMAFRVAGGTSIAYGKDSHDDHCSRRVLRTSTARRRVLA